MICPACETDNMQGADACDNCGTSLYQEDIPLAHARTELERNLHEAKVEVLKPKTPITARESSTLSDAVKVMRENRIGCLVITGENGGLSGILTEADLIGRLAVEEEDLSLVAVSKVMTTEVECLRLDHPLGYVLQRMRVTDCRHLPVVDDEGNAVGVVSSRDVLNYLEATLEALP